MWFMEIKLYDANAMYFMSFLNWLLCSLYAYIVA